MAKKMAWERFEFPNLCAPVVNVSRTGLIIIGRRACRRYGLTPGLVILCWDRQESLIGFRSVRDGDQETDAVRLYSGQSTRGKCFIWAKRFLEWFEIPPCSGSYILNRQARGKNKGVCYFDIQKPLPARGSRA
jgi:hypothetical protein